MIHTFTNHMSKLEINRCSHSAFMVIEFSSSVVSPSFIHTASFVVIPLFTFTDVLSSDDALRDMLESEMTTTGIKVWVGKIFFICLKQVFLGTTNIWGHKKLGEHCLLPWLPARMQPQKKW